MQTFIRVTISMTIDERNKDDRWYLDSAAIVHVTHDLTLFISSDLNDDTELIETVSDEQIETRESGTIDLKMIIDDKIISVTISNVHYCLELDSNLISLEVLEVKDFEFRGKSEWLRVIDQDEDIMLESRRQNKIYSLNQSRHFSYSTKISKTLMTKKVDQDM